MKKKILSFVIIALLTTVSVTVVVLTKKQQQTSKDAASQQLRTIMSFATSAIQVGLSNGLAEFIQSTLQQIQTNPSFHSGIVYDEDMIPLLTLPQEFKMPEDIEQSLSQALPGEAQGTPSVSENLSSETKRESSISRDSILYHLSLIEDDDGEALGYLLLSFDNAVIQSQAKKSLMFALTVSIAIAVPIILLMAWQLSRMINPIITTTKNMKMLADGNTDIELAGMDRRDEIGSMIQALKVFKEGLIERKEFTAKLASAFEDHVGGVLKSLSSSVSDLASTSTLLSSVAREGNNRATSLAKTSDSTSSSVHSVASAAEELSCSIKEITQQIEQSKEFAGKSVSEADVANRVIVELAESHKEVDDILGFINDVSAQTKLLALNASIEAARAGEAGRGFAVVADEVKKLSTKTEDATSQIAQKINGIQQQLQTTTTVIEGVSKTIHQVNEISETISTAIKQNNLAIQEIAQNAQVAAHSTQETMGSVSNVALASEKTGYAAKDMDQTIRTLVEQSNTLRTEIEKFLSSTSMGNTP